MTDLGANAALRLACQLGDEQAARAALAAGADCNYVPPGEAGSSIAFAAWNGHGEICQMLLAAGAQANEREVMDAALAGGWIALAEWLRSSVAYMYSESTEGTQGVVWSWEQGSRRNPMARLLRSARRAKPWLRVVDADGRPPPSRRLHSAADRQSMGEM